jgi:hypothetical protein
MRINVLNVHVDHFHNTDIGLDIRLYVHKSSWPFSCSVYSQFLEYCLSQVRECNQSPSHFITAVSVYVGKFTVRKNCENMLFTLFRSHTFIDMGRQ